MWATTALHCLTHPDHQRIHRPLSPQAGLTKVAAAKATLAAINPDVELVRQQSINQSSNRLRPGRSTPPRPPRSSPPPPLPLTRFDSHSDDDDV